MLYKIFYGQSRSLDGFVISVHLNIFDDSICRVVSTVNLCSAVSNADV